MLFSGDIVVADCVGFTSPRRSSKDGSVVLKVCVGVVRAREGKETNSFVASGSLTFTDKSTIIKVRHFCYLSYSLRNPIKYIIFASECISLQVKSLITTHPSETYRWFLLYIYTLCEEKSSLDVTAWYYRVLNWNTAVQSTWTS